MINDILVNLLSSLIIAIFLELWRKSRKLKLKANFWKVLGRIILSPILGLFLGGIVAKIIKSYTGQEIPLESFLAIALISIGTLIVWFILSNFGFLKSK